MCAGANLRKKKSPKRCSCSEAGRQREKTGDSVRYVPDRTGRFTQRPHYEPKELDRECESIVSGFLRERHGAASYPISTDDLTVLIERDTESLDQFADLTAYGPK